MDPIAQIIIAFATLITSATTAYLQVRNGDRMKKVEAKVEVVHKATNSMKDELVAAVKVASHAEGVTEGKAEEKATSLVAAAAEMKDELVDATKKAARAEGIAEGQKKL